MGNKLNIAGQKFGNLSVLQESGESRKDGSVLWCCRCDCGKEVTVRAHWLESGKTKSCGCRRKIPHHWKGCGEISASFWYNQTLHAKSRNRTFTITIGQAWELFQKQNRRCAYTGLKLSFSRNYRDDKISQTASLDRIDSSKGYESGNIQWVHKAINRMKNVLSSEDFKKYCFLVSNPIKDQG